MWQVIICNNRNICVYIYISKREIWVKSSLKDAYVSEIKPYFLLKDNVLFILNCNYRNERKLKHDQFPRTNLYFYRTPCIFGCSVFCPKFWKWNFIPLKSWENFLSDGVKFCLGSGFFWLNSTRLIPWNKNAACVWDFRVTGRTSLFLFLVAWLWISEWRII